MHFQQRDTTPNYDENIETPEKSADGTYPQIEARPLDYLRNGTLDRKATRPI
jgi:hypothetical protein